MISYEIDDNRESIGSIVQVTAHLTHAYDGSLVTQGTATFSPSGSDTIDVNGDAVITPSKNSVGIYDYYVSSVTGTDHGITVIGDIDFDGSGDYVEVADNSLLEPTSLTIAVWVKLTSDGNRHIIVCKWTGYSLEVGSDGKPYICINDGTQRNTYSDTAISWNTWVHIAGTYDESTDTARIYINGEDTTTTGQGTGIGSPIYNSQSLRISETRYTSGDVNGAVDDVRIYSTAFTGDIFKIYQGAYTSTTNLRLWFDETSCDVADNKWYDKSGNNLDGIFTGASVDQGSSYSVSPIWDELTIEIQADKISPPDSVPLVTFTVTISYQYDAEFCSSWTIDIQRNDTTVWIDDLVSPNTFTDSQSIDVCYDYQVSSASEIIYGLTAFETNIVIVTWDDDTTAPVVTEVDCPKTIDFMNTLTITCDATDIGDGLGDALLYLSDNGITWADPLSDSPVSGTYEWQITDITDYLSTDLYFYMIINDSDDDRGPDDVLSTQTGIVIVEVTIDACYYTDLGSLFIEDIEPSLLYNVTLHLDATISYYRYLSLEVSGENWTTTQLDIITDTGSHIQTLDLNAGYNLFDLSTLGSQLYLIEFQVKPDGTGTGLLEVTEIRVSPIDKKIDERTQVNIEYMTTSSTVSLVMDNHLLSWDYGTLEVDDINSVYVETEIIDWYNDYIFVRQTLYTGGHIDIMISSDGRVDILTSSESIDLSFTMIYSCEKYSDSFGIVESSSSDLIIRTPTFAAMYANSVGFGITDLTGQEIASSPADSKFDVDSSTEKIILLPTLSERFQIVSGVEIDPNFVISMTDIHTSGLITGWQGGIESQDAAFIDGEFNEEYAILETFETQDRWIIDNDNNGATSQSTEMALAKTEVSFKDGKMNVTVNANETTSDVVVFEYNYVQFTASSYPFLKLVIDGDGRLQIDVKLRIDDTRHTVLSMTPDGLGKEVINIHAKLEEIQTDLSQDSVSAIELWLDETDVSNDPDNKSIFIDEIAIYRIQGWELVYNIATTTTASVVESDGNTLVLRSDKQKQIVMKRTLAYVEATIHRIFQWRERVGYSSTINITAVDSTSSSFTFEDDNVDWAVVTEDIGSAADGSLILYLNLTAGIAIESKGYLDWIRIVAPFTSEYTWEGFNDGSMAGSGEGYISPYVEPPLLFHAPEEVPEPPTGIEYTENGVITHNEDGTHSFTYQLGEQNTWNGTNWVRYVYNPLSKYVKIGNTTIYHNAGGELSLETDSGLHIDGLRWYVQAYYNEQWNNITLDNYQFVGFTKTADNISAVQRFWSSQGEMNVTITYTRFHAFKIRVDVTNWADQAVPIRPVWVARGISGLVESGFELIRNTDGIVTGFRVDDMTLSWLDVCETTPDIPINYVVDRENNRAVIVFGNLSTVIASGETLVIDPSWNYVMNYDVDDVTIRWLHGTYDDEEKGLTENKVYPVSDAGISFGTYWIAPMYQAGIHQRALITSAYMYMFSEVTSAPWWDAGDTLYVRRVDPSDHDIGYSDTPEYLSRPYSFRTESNDKEWSAIFPGGIWANWVGLDVLDLVQYQIDDPYDREDDHIGFYVYAGTETRYIHRFRDWEFGAHDGGPKITINWQDDQAPVFSDVAPHQAWPPVDERTAIFYKWIVGDNARVEAMIYDRDGFDLVSKPTATFKWYDYGTGNWDDLQYTDPVEMTPKGGEGWNPYAIVVEAESQIRYSTHPNHLYKTMLLEIDLWAQDDDNHNLDGYFYSTQNQFQDDDPNNVLGKPDVYYTQAPDSHIDQWEDIFAEGYAIDQGSGINIGRTKVQYKDYYSSTWLDVPSQYLDLSTIGSDYEYFDTDSDPETPLSWLPNRMDFTYTIDEALYDNSDEGKMDVRIVVYDRDDERGEGDNAYEYGARIVTIDDDDPDPPTLPDNNVKFKREGDSTTFQLHIDVSVKPDYVLSTRIGHDDNDIICINPLDASGIASVRVYYRISKWNVLGSSPITTWGWSDQAMTEQGYGWEIEMSDIWDDYETTYTVSREDYESYEGIMYCWDLWFEVTDDDTDVTGDQSTAHFKKEWAFIPRYYQVIIEDDDPNDDYPYGTVTPVSGGLRWDEAYIRADVYRDAYQTDTQIKLYYNYKKATSQNWIYSVWEEITTYVGTYPNGHFLVDATELDLDESWEYDHLEFILKMEDFDDDWTGTSGDDDCIWYYGVPSGESDVRWYGGEDTTNDGSAPTEGRKILMEDNDSEYPEIIEDTYGTLMIEWSGINDGVGIAPTYGMYVNVTVIDEEGISSDQLDTYLEIIGVDGESYFFYINDAETEIIDNGIYSGNYHSYTVMFKVSGFYPGEHDYAIMISDDDSSTPMSHYYDCTELEYLDGQADDTVYPIVFVDDDTTSPEVQGRTVPEFAIHYDQNFVIVFNVTDESSPDPELVVTKYSINYGGWIEVPKTQLEHGNPYTLYEGQDIIGYNYTLTIDEGHVFYRDGFLFVQLTVFASDMDYDSVADMSDTEYHPMDTSPGWYTVHMGLAVIDEVSPSFIPDSFNGPDGDVLYDDGNIVQVTAFEEWDASLVSHGYLNYTTDDWTSWTVTDMVPVGSQTISYAVRTTLAGRIPLIYNSPVIKYRVIVFDNAGNSVDYECTLQIDSVGDETLPEFLYSRILGAEPSVNGTIAARFYEPLGSSGMKGVKVTVKVGLEEKEYDMTYCTATDSWIYHLPQFDESTTIEYKFRAYDNARPTEYLTTDWFSYYVQDFTALFNIDGDVLNNLPDANTVAHMRTFFSVGTRGAYGFVPIYTGHVANFTMWLDGMLIPNGVQMILDTNVHVLMVQVDAAEKDAMWGVKLVNMRSNEESSDGVLEFNILAPAPDNDEFDIEDVWAGGLLTLMEHHTSYEYHDTEYIDGSFEAGWLDGWNNRKSHIIYGTIGAGRNYQVQIQVSNYLGTDSGNHMYALGCQTDFDDIRFASDDGVTLLDHWLENVDDEGSGKYTALFWIEVIDNLDYDQIIFVYFGNDSAVSESDGEATFIFFDDFDSDNWTKTGSTITVSGGQTHWDSSTSYGDGEQNITPLGNGWAMGGHVYQDTNPNIGLMLIGVRDSYGSAYGDTNDGLYFRIYDDVMSEIALEYTGGSTSSCTTGAAIYTDTDYWWNIGYNGTHYTFEMWSDYYTTQVGTTSINIWSPTNEIDVVHISTRNVNGWDGESNYFYIREFIGVNEPTHGTWNNEQCISLDDWDYRQSHEIQGVAGACEGYQVQIKIDYDATSSTGNTLGANSNCETDFRDIRFVDSDGVTLLDYWLEEYTTSDSAIFWVEVLDDLSFDQTIYVYYGNDVATTTSNGDTTFLFFDDFNGSVIDTDKWNVTIGQEGDDFDVVNGYVEFLDAADERANIISYDADSWTGGIALEFNWYWESAWNIIAAGLCEPDPTYGYWSGSDDAAIYETRSTDSWDVENDGGNDHIETYTSTNSVWSTQGVYWYSTSHMEIYDQRVEQFDYTTGLPNEDLHVIFSSYDGDSDNEFKVDWVFVRNLVESGPTHGSWGSAETPTQNSAGGWGAWEYADDSMIVIGGYDNSNSAVRLYYGTDGWLEYDYPDRIFTSGISFYYLDSLNAKTNVSIKFQLEDDTWHTHNVTLDTIESGEWRRCIADVPHREVQRIRIEHIDSNSPGDLKIDDISILRYKAEVSRWSAVTYDDISPHSVLGLTGGALTVNYAAYAEFLVEEPENGMLEIECGNDLQGVNISIYHQGSLIAEVSGNISIPFTVVSGINRIALYIEAVDATDDYLKFILTDSSQPLSIDIMGQGTGLLSVTSESSGTVLPFVDGEWNVTSVNADVDIERTTGLSLDMNLEFSDDDSEIIITRIGLGEVDIRTAPVLQSSFTTNSTGLEMSYRFHVSSAAMGESVWVATEWFELVGSDQYNVDIGFLVSEIYHTLATEYDKMLAFEIHLRDASDDGNPVGPQIVTIVPVLMSRVAFIYKLERSIDETPTLYNDFDIETGYFTYTENAFHGYGAAEIGGSVDPLVLNWYMANAPGRSLRFMSDGVVTTTATIIVDRKEYSFIVGNKYITVQELFDGWSRNEVVIFEAISDYVDENSLAGNLIIKSVELDSASQVTIDSLKIESGTNIEVSVPYWCTTLHWSSNVLGFTVNDIGSMKTAPYYSVDYDGVTYSTSNSSWYRIV
ncbi:MAG: DUF2341 domain-containing protein, partial [Candidatus Thorarchaeota archaeon]